MINIKNILIAIDQLFNTIAGGDPDETISSRVGKYHKGSLLYKLLNFIEKNHCENSIEKDEGENEIIK